MVDIGLSTLQRLEYFFEFDNEKLALWLNTDNVLLGGLSPNHMIGLGRADKLDKFINSSLDGNRP